MRVELGSRLGLRLGLELGLGSGSGSGHGLGTVAHDETISPCRCAVSRPQIKPEGGG